MTTLAKHVVYEHCGVERCNRVRPSEERIHAPGRAIGNRTSRKYQYHTSHAYNLLVIHFWEVPRDHMHSGTAQVWHDAPSLTTRTIRTALRLQ